MSKPKIIIHLDGSPPDIIGPGVTVGHIREAAQFLQRWVDNLVVPATPMDTPADEAND